MKKRNTPVEKKTPQGARLKRAESLFWSLAEKHRTQSVFMALAVASGVPEAGRDKRWSEVEEAARTRTISHDPRGSAA